MGALRGTQGGAGSQGCGQFSIAFGHRQHEYVARCVAKHDGRLRLIQRDVAKQGVASIVIELVCVPQGNDRMRRAHDGQ